MGNEEIKKANRKALPKFILLCIVGALIGGVAGYLVGANGIDTMSGDFKVVVSNYVELTAPWIMLAIAVIIPIVLVPYYRKAKKQLSQWDGEDEEVSDGVEEKLSIIQWVSSGALIISYFLIAASYSGGTAMFESVNNMIGLTVSIAAFLGIMAEVVIMQQKSVDCVKIMNPEKTASVYDMKFQKKWLETCDEAEKIIVGKCAFKAFNITNSMCSVLAVILAISALHITMVGMLVYRMLKKIISVIQAAVLSSVIMLFYLYITGNSVSAGRAVIMILVFMLADVLGRTSDGANTLGLAVVILIIKKPFFFSKAGFFISFFSMAGIIFFKTLFFF